MVRAHPGETEVLGYGLLKTVGRKHRCQDRHCGFAVRITCVERQPSGMAAIMKVSPFR